MAQQNEQMNLDRDALLKHLGVDPRSPDDLAANRASGEAAGNDMSWMDAPGATTIGQNTGVSSTMPPSSPADLPMGSGRSVWSEEYTLPDGTVIGPGGVISPKVPISTTMPVTSTDAPQRGPTSDMPERPMGAPLPAAGGATATGQTEAATPSISGAKYTGYQPKYAMEGFNFAREQDPTKSAKDAFAMLANQAPPPPLNDKAALGQWFSQYIQPGMESLGHHVKSVNGDTFSYENPEGAYTVDYGRGAGAEGGALAWQAQDPGQGEGPGGAVGSFGAPQRQAMSDNGSAQTDPLAQIMAEIQALQGGTQSPMDAEALMKLLQPDQAQV